MKLKNTILLSICSRLGMRTEAVVPVFEIFVYPVLLPCREMRSMIKALEQKQELCPGHDNSQVSVTFEAACTLCLSATPLRF
jgi:hypothetical protein